MSNRLAHTTGVFRRGAAMLVFYFTSIRIVCARPRMAAHEHADRIKCELLGNHAIGQHKRALWLRGVERYGIIPLGERPLPVLRGGASRSEMPIVCARLLRDIYFPVTTSSWLCCRTSAGLSARL